MAKTRNTRSTKSKKSVQAKAPAPVATPVVEAPVIEVAAAAEMPAPVLRPSHDAIARRAFEIYLGRAGRPGNPLEDWFAAERELSSRAA